MKGSSFLIIVGVITLLTSILVMWGSTQIIVEQSEDPISNTLQIAPNDYSYQEITFNPEWNTRFSFIVREGTIKYVLMDVDDFKKWFIGQPTEWIEASSNSTMIGGTMPVNGEVPTPSMYYLFYNDDSYYKTIYFQSYKSKSEITTNYLYMIFGFSFFVLGTETLIFGLYKRLQA